MWERNIDWLLSIFAPTRDWTRNWGMCPNQELNWWPFSLWDNSQPTEPYQPGIRAILISYYNYSHATLNLLLFGILVKMWIWIKYGWNCVFITHIGNPNVYYVVQVCKVGTHLFFSASVVKGLHYIKLTCFLL